MRAQHIAVMVLLLPLCAWGGCSQVQKPTVPKVVYVTVPEPVSLPDELTTPCPPVHAKTRTVEAVVSAYNTNIATQEDCDKRMGQIRALQPEATK